MEKINSVCVFTGSSFGNSEKYRSDAVALARLFAENSITLVYGGGNKGIMGVLAKELKRLGGHVIGVLPKAMDIPSVRTEDVESELIIVQDMHERKKKMYSLSDAFIALPGGIGTLEEFSEIFTWRQIGLHDKNIALFNIEGFFDPLLVFLESIVAQGLMTRDVLDSLIVSDDIDVMLSRLDGDRTVLPEKID